ncbi:MAG: cupin protein, partial [Cyanobacteria bacterium RYN_339]|nr:cupin protein [Cyanobacteria bacterium RYN_339]
MSEIIPKHFSDLSHYLGEHEIPGIKFRYAGKDLGISTWGMNVIELGPHCTSYPEHDHTSDGEEEVYVVLSGSAVLQSGSSRWPLEPGMLVRVGPERKRKIVTGSRGVVILALGGLPDKPEGAATKKATVKKAAVKT